MLAGFEFFHQEAILVVAQQVTTNRWRIEMSHVEIDKGVIELFNRCFVNAFGFRPLKARLKTPWVRCRRRRAPLPVSSVQPACSYTSSRTVAGLARASILVLTNPSEAPTSWAARITTSLITMTVTVAPETASTVMAFGSLERPTTTR